MKKITKIFASIFALLLVCVGAISLGGCKDSDTPDIMLSNTVYGQEFTVLDYSITSCKKVSFNSLKIAIKFRGSILNTTDEDFNFNSLVYVLSWDNNKLTYNSKTSIPFSSDTSEEYGKVSPKTVKVLDWGSEMTFTYDFGRSWDTEDSDCESITKILKNINFTLKYNGVQVGYFNMDVSNISFD